MMTLYRHPKLNSHGKEAYVLRATPSQTTPTYPKFPTMIYLLSNAPHGDITAPARTTQRGVVNLFKGSGDRNAVVRTQGQEGFVYLLGDLNNLETQLNSKYDYQLRRLKAKCHIVPDDTEAKKDIRAALDHCGIPSATNKRVYYLPALSRALDKFKKGTARATVSPARLTKLAIAWHSNCKFGKPTARKASEEALVAALTRWDSLPLFDEPEYAGIWTSKTHKVNARDRDRLAKIAHDRKAGDEPCLPGWLHSIVRKFEKHLAVKPKEDEYLTAAQQFSKLTGYDAALIQKSNCTGFGLSSATGAATLARWTRETENMFYDMALYLEHAGLPLETPGAFGVAQKARHQLFTNVEEKSSSGRCSNLRILKDTATLVARELLDFFNGFDFKSNTHVYERLVSQLEVKNLHFNIPCDKTKAKQKNPEAHRQHKYTLANMEKLAALYLLRDEICGRPCKSVEHFCRALFTARGSIYVRMFYCVVARANIAAAQRVKEKKLAKKADSQRPDLFGPYLMTALDVQHAVCLRLYSENKPVWAGFFVNYFRIFIEKRFGCRIAPMVTLNILSRKDFNRLTGKGFQHLTYGVHIVVDHKEGDPPAYSIYKKEAKQRLQQPAGARKKTFDIDNQQIVGTQMFEWANECKSMRQSEPWIYADTSTTRHHLTNLQDSSSCHHDVDCHNFPQNEIALQTNPRYVYATVFDDCLNVDNRIVKQSVEDMAKAYENVVFDMACDACKHLTDAAAYRSTKGKKNARELAMCCGHLFKGTKQKIAAETFIKTTKVDCYVDGEWVSSSIRYLPHPPINARDYGTWGMVVPTQRKQEHSITANLNAGFNDLWHQVAAGLPITLKRKVYSLDRDVTFPFEMKEGAPCVYSEGVWTAEKMKSLRAAPDAMVHISTLGRYQETQMLMAANEYARVFNITTPAYVAEALRRDNESATAMAHESVRVRLENYLVTKDTKLRNVGKVLPGDIGQRDADGNPTGRLITYAANNPDEFPWSNEICLQAPAEADSDISMRHHQASNCSTAEQSMMRYRLDKHRQHQQVLKKLDEGGIDTEELKLLIRWDKDMVRASEEKWKKNWPKQWEARRTWTQALADKAAALLSPRKRARTASDAGSSKRVKRGGTPE